jgi:hypothetical protein
MVTAGVWAHSAPPRGAEVSLQRLRPWLDTPHQRAIPCGERTGVSRSVLRSRLHSGAGTAGPMGKPLPSVLVHPPELSGVSTAHLVGARPRPPWSESHGSPRSVRVMCRLGSGEPMSEETGGLACTNHVAGSSSKLVLYWWRLPSFRSTANRLESPGPRRLEWETAGKNKSAFGGVLLEVSASRRNHLTIIGLCVV